MDTRPTPNSALLLFSGGQDSATCLAWALSRFDRVETVGFDYGQRHRAELFAADALIVGSPVYWSNMAGPVKTFFDDWQFRFGVYPEFKMQDKVGAAFTTGGQVSGGKEVTMLTILVSGGGAFGASATTEGESPGIDEQELRDARALGRRVAEVAWMIKRGREQRS